MRTRVIQVDPKHPDPAAIKEAAGTLKRGGLVAFPTETVYGLGANLEDPQAIQELYRVKQRPFDKQVTLAIPDPGVVGSYGVEVSDFSKMLMERFWPGPLTLVLSRKGSSPLGFRMPKHPVALELLKEAQVPVAVPSANLSGHPPPRTAEEVLRDLSDQIDLLLDGGLTPLGLESTVLDLSGPCPLILRRGAMAEAIEELLSSLEKRNI